MRPARPLIKGVQAVGMSGAAAVAHPAAAPPDLLVLAQFEAGLDGLAENDLVDEAEVDSIVRETVLNTMGDTPWADAKVGLGQEMGA